MSKEAEEPFQTGHQCDDDEEGTCCVLHLIPQSCSLPANPLTRKPRPPARIATPRLAIEPATPPSAFACKAAGQESGSPMAAVYTGGLQEVENGEMGDEVSKLPSGPPKGSAILKFSRKTSLPASKLRQYTVKKPADAYSEEEETK